MERNMKLVKLTCLKCGKTFYHINYWHWIWKAPMHWFGKRYDKCFYCGKRSWMKRDKKNGI